jgi:Domain of unknown function (DUF4258)
MADDTLRFSDHARERMRQRSVSDEDVGSALRRPWGRPRAGSPGTVWIAGFAVDGRILRVCVPTDERTFVITVAWQESDLRD